MDFSKFNFKDLEDARRHINLEMMKVNNTGLPEFEGYSPEEMHNLLHHTFGSNSPIQILEMKDADYKEMPMINQVKYLAGLLASAGEIKLTSKGFLPTKVVADLYAQGFIKDEYIEKSISRLYKETDAMSINLTRLLVEMSGLTKKRNGKLSLTKAGEKILSNNHELTRLIFVTFATGFNWAYYDGYGDNHVGQMGLGFSLVLLSRYGREMRDTSFYAGKYFKAYPMLLEEFEDDYSTAEEQAENCYTVRTFNRFLDYFGLIEIQQKGVFRELDIQVAKSDLFDKFIKCLPHKGY